MSTSPSPKGSDRDAPDEQLEELTRRFAHRVGYFSRRIERRFGLADVWRDDLMSAGYWGLLKALRNRRADAHEHELFAYVSQRVEGAVLDEARAVLTRISNHAPCVAQDEDAGGVGEGAELEWTFGHPVEDPEAQVDRHSRWRVVELALGELESNQRDLLLAYAAGRSVAEIARDGGTSPARLQSRMTRVARQVRANAPELRRLLRHEI